MFLALTDSYTGRKILAHVSDIACVIEITREDFVAGKKVVTDEFSYTLIKYKTYNETTRSYYDKNSDNQVLEISRAFETSKVRETIEEIQSQINQVQLPSLSSSLSSNLSPLHNQPR